MAKIEQIRPIYSELQGYLSQAPKVEIGNEIDTTGIALQVNKTIDELNQVTGGNYNRYKIVTKTGQSVNNYTYEYVDVIVYRSNISGLISRLHGEFFSDEVPPFSGTPTAVFSQSQQQNQELRVQMVLEVQDIINEKLSKLDESSTKEKGFLEKVKGGLKSIHSVVQLIWLLLSTAKECGLSIDELKEIFN